MALHGLTAYLWLNIEVQMHGCDVAIILMHIIKTHGHVSAAKKAV